MLRFALAALAAAFLATGAAAADTYPSRPVKIIVPFAAGGPADVYARVLGSRLEKALGKAFVIEDMPGGGSIVGTEAVAKSQPDGYTLLMMSNTHTVNESLIKDKPFQLMRDFVPVAPVNYSDLVLAVHPSVPAKTLKELIALAKSKPGVLNYASSGPGTPYHMAGELFKAMAGVDIVHVPYKGSSGARTDLLGGQVQMMFDAITTMAPHVEAGKVRALGTTGKVRSSVLPERAHPLGGGRAGLRGRDLARHHGAEGHAAGHRRPAERRDPQGRHLARARGRVEEAGRGAHVDDARGVRQVPARRHREVGAHRDDLGRAPGPLAACRRSAS